MKLDYRVQGKVKINMTDDLKNIMNDLQDKYHGRAITPAGNNLFEVNENMRKLSEKDSQALHTIVATLLYLTFSQRWSFSHNK